MVAQISTWVERFASQIPHGKVLDLACGQGRHTRFLAASGRQVVALDKDVSAVQAIGGEQIQVVQFDLEPSEEQAAWCFQEAEFAGIVVCNYLHRPLFPYLLSSLVPGGLLIYETFAAGNESVGKPSRLDFLLQTGELLTRCADLRIVAYEDGFLTSPERFVQRIVAVKLGPTSASNDHAASMPKRYLL
ncbi:class I SAM-dependent methyltransferase [Undibacterium luofuense]|uniref:class I SAM-dependent methyltransferase n=1 Tax=Undibacterium luofuense TaxID=2828733 RepID=UPI0030EE1373